MRRWIAGILFVLTVACFGGVTAWAQEDEAAKANALWNDGKRLDALPLYEDLARDHPKEWMYQERLAVALGVKAEMATDPAEVKALVTRERDAAKRAVELGDPNYSVQLMTQIDPGAPIVAAPGSPAQALQQEAEKAWGIGDYATALAKYAAAAEADPKLYEAPLYAGDTAYAQKDLKTAAKWFARAISVDPNRETAYRYWGDALLRIGHDAAAAKEKYIDAIVAEPYNRLAWQGIQQWAQVEKAVILAPKIDRPAGPVADPKNPKGVTITMPAMNGKKPKDDPSGALWLSYSMRRALWMSEDFRKNFPDEKEYRHTLREEDESLTLTLTVAKELKARRDQLDESLRNLVDLNDAGMLDCWILINGADQGIAQDYASYRNEHRQLLHDYLERFVVHGGVNSIQ